MAGHFHPAWRQQYPRHLHATPIFPPTHAAPTTARPILTFHGCACTYLEPIPSQHPLDPTRLLHLESLSPHPLSPSNSPHRPKSLLHISGACRIHEFAQFMAVQRHILKTGYHHLLQAEAKKDDVEWECIKADCTRRLHQMARKLMGRWGGVGVGFGEGMPTFRFGEDGAFTREERRLHTRGEVEVVFTG